MLIGFDRKLDGKSDSTQRTENFASETLYRKYSVDVIYALFVGKIFTQYIIVIICKGAQRF